MRLYHTPTSPFVRKVMVAAHELGLADRIETTFLRPSPVEANAELSARNPLDKIPALILDDGSALYDSHVICEYLDTLGARRTIPSEGPERFRVLRQEALSDGILEASVLVFYEKQQRPKELHWQPWIDGQSRKARQALDAFEREVGAFSAEIDLGQIAIACTLGWLEFRGVLGDVRSSRPALFGWYDRFRERPSMRATEPHA